MRKIYVIAFLVSVLVLIGCAKTPSFEAKTDSEVESWIDISYANLESVMNDETRFILLISSETCQSCIEFEPILQSFIDETDVVIYRIEANRDFPTDNELFPYQYTPTLHLVENGTSLYSFDPIKNKNVFDSLSNFQAFIDKYITY